MAKTSINLYYYASKRSVGMYVHRESPETKCTYILLNIEHFFWWWGLKMYVVLKLDGSFSIIFNQTPMFYHCRMYKDI